MRLKVERAEDHRKIDCEPIKKICFNLYAIQFVYFFLICKIVN